MSYTTLRWLREGSLGELASETRNSFGSSARQCLLDTAQGAYETGNPRSTSNEYGRSERIKRLRREAGALLNFPSRGQLLLLQMTIGHRSYLK